MAHLMMDNPLTPTLQVQLGKTVQDLHDCVSELRREYSEGGAPVTDDCQTLHRFCAKLEFLMQNGLKSKTSLLGGRKDYWNYFCDSLAGNKGLSDGIRFVKSVSELKTNLGRGRAFIRFCLMHHRIADTIQQCVYNTKVTIDWYHAKAVWHQPQMTSSLVNILYDLNDVTFDLSPRGYDLDASWPTFARKQFGSNFSWAPPSRSTSISSIASVPNQDLSSHNLSSSFGTSSQLSPAADAGMDRLRSELNEVENERLHLQVKVESLVEEKKRTLIKVADLESQLLCLQKDNNKLQLQCDRQEMELKMKEEMFMEKETVWKGLIEEAEKNVSELSMKVQTNKVAASAAQPEQGATSRMNAQLDMTELKMKLATQTKANQALKVEMKSIEMQLSMKTKIDEGKSKLVELLDKKVTQLDTKNKQLREMLEDAVKTRENEADKLIEMGGNKEISQQLEESEKAYQDLKKMNHELRGMLHELEGKSQKIAQIAKEKVIKYSEISKQLQETVDDLTNQLRDARSGGKIQTSQISDEKLNTEREKLMDELETLRRSLNEKDSQLQKLDAELKEYKQESQSMEVQRAERDREVTKSLEGLQNPIKMMKTEFEQLKEQLQSRNDSPDGATVALIPVEDAQEKICQIESEKQRVLEELDAIAVKEKELLTQNELLGEKLKQNEEEMNQMREELGSMKKMLTMLEQEIDSGDVNGDKQVLNNPFCMKIREIFKEKIKCEVQMKSVEGENADLRTKIQTESQQTLELSQKLETVTLHLGELNSKSEDLRSRLDEKNADFQVKVKEFDEFKVKKEEEITTKQSEIEKLMDLKVSSTKTLEEEKSQLIHELEELKQYIEQRNDTDKQTEEQTKDLNTEIQSLNEHLQKSKRECDKLCKERDGIKEEINDVQRKNDNLEGQIEELTQQIASVEGDEQKLQTIQNMLSAEKEKRKKIEAAAEELKENLKSAEEALSLAQESKESAEQDHNDKVDKIEKELKSLREENEKLKESIDDHLIEMATLREGQEGELFRQKAAIEQLGVENVTLKATLSEHQEEIVKLGSEKDTLRKSQEELQCALVRVNEENATLTECLAKEKSGHANVTEELATVKTERNNLEEERDNLLKEKEVLEEEKENYLEEIAEKDQQRNLTEGEHNFIHNSLKDRIGELETENEQISMKLKDAELKVASITEEVEKITVNKNNLESQIMRLQSELECLQIALSEKTAEFEHSKKVCEETQGKASHHKQMEENLVKEKRGLEAETEELKVKLEEVKHTLSILQSEKNVLHESMNKSSSDMDNKISELMQKKDEATTKMEQAIKGKQTAELKLRELCIENEEMENVLERKSMECEQKKKKVTELESALHKVHEDLYQMGEKVKDKEAELKQVREDLQKEVSALQFQLSTEQMQKMGPRAELNEMMETLAQQESVIETLEGELEQVKRERMEEREKQWDELLELKQSLSSRDAECKLLTVELKRTSMQLDEEKNLLLKIKKEAGEREKRKDEEILEKIEELEALKKDHKDIRQQLVKIVRDKAALWEQKDQLDELRRLIVGGTWMDNNSVNNCLGCNAEFGWMLRKHHCRMCGRIFCHTCSNYWIQTPHDSKKVRACNECVLTQSQLGSPSGADESGTADDPREGPSGEPGGSTRMDAAPRPSHSESTMSEASTSTTDSFYASPLEDSTQDIAQAHIVTSTPVKSEPKIKSSVKSSKVESVNEQASATVSVPDESKDTEVQGSALETSLPESGADGTRSESANSEGEEKRQEDFYDMITEEEVLQSMHESMMESDPKYLSAGMVSVDHITDGKVQPDPDLWIKAGKVYTVPVFIEQTGVTLRWEFSTQPKDIGFGATYQESVTTPFSAAEYLIETVRCNSHKQAIQGELVARKQGVYTLLFDNTHSRFTSKKLEYKLEVELPTSSTVIGCEESRELDTEPYMDLPPDVQTT